MNPSDQPPTFPQSEEAEKGLLSCFLQAPVATIDAARQKGITEASFFGIRGLIFEAICKLHDNSRPVSLISLIDALRSSEQLEKVGGAAELVELGNYSPAPAHWEFYATILREKHLLRQLIHIASQAAQDARRPVEDVSAFLSQFEGDVLALTQRAFTGAESGPRAMSKVMLDAIMLAEAWATKGGSGTRTGFSRLDLLTNGLHDHSMFVLAGRPSTGKTTLGLNICWNIASAGTPCAIFSHETNGELLALRLQSHVSKVPFGKVRCGAKLTETDYAHQIGANKEIVAAPIWLDDTANMNATQLRSRVRHLVAEHGVKVVMIDYLQLIEPVSKRGQETEYAAVTEVSRALKHLSIEFPICVLALCQLNRGAGPVPTMKDLRSSGQIEQDATEIALLYSETDIAQDAEDIEVTLRLAKQKDGSPGDIKLTFKRPTFTFKTSTVTTHDTYE